MDRQEFMFFLTGGVGLENKVRNWLYSDYVYSQLSLLNSSPIRTHPGYLISPGMRFVGCVTYLPSRSFDRTLKRMPVCGRNCTMIESLIQLHYLNLGTSHLVTFKR